MAPLALPRGAIAIVAACDVWIATFQGASRGSRISTRCPHPTVWQKCVGPAQSLQSRNNPGFRHRLHAVATAVRAQTRKTTHELSRYPAGSRFRDAGQRSSGGRQDMASGTSGILERSGQVPAARSGTLLCHRDQAADCLLEGIFRRARGAARVVSQIFQCGTLLGRFPCELCFRG